MNIVITGASRGIGYNAALQFAVNPSNTVFAISRNEAGLRRLKAESGGHIVPVICDVSDEESVKGAVATITKQCSSIDVLINNAGSLIKKSISELTLKDWKEVYGVNVFGAFILTQQLIPLLRGGGLDKGNNIRSHVVNIASIGGLQGSIKFDGLSAYSSSKGAMITMTECLSHELREEGIRVNCLALGSVDTEMFVLAFPGMKAGGEVKEVSDWIVEFSERGWRFFNGKTLPLSTTTP